MHGPTIGTALFWFAIGRLLTDDRRVLVPLFVMCALATWLAILLVQGGANPEEVEN